MYRQPKKQYVSPLLQPPLNRLFIPRVPLEPFTKKPKKKHLKFEPVSAYMHKHVVSPSSKKCTTTSSTPSPPPQITKKQRIQEKKIKAREQLEQARQEWNPKSNPNTTKDPSKTLFVGRLSPDVREETLKGYFDRYGTIVDLKIVKKKNEKQAAYAFIEYEKESCVRTAYTEADAMRIGNHRIVVDIERGRTIKDWYPRRLGGGLGRSRLGARHQNQKRSGRDERTEDLYGNALSSQQQQQQYHHRQSHSSRSRGYPDGDYRDSRKRSMSREGGSGNLYRVDTHEHDRHSRSRRSSHDRQYSSDRRYHRRY